MKVKSILFCGLMLLMGATALQAQVEKYANPDEATYNITGDMVVDRKIGKRYLMRAEGKNIRFVPKYRREAEYNPRSEYDDLTITFDSVDTDRPEGMEGRLHFWRYDSVNMEWQYDREAQKGKTEIQSTMKTNVVLVLDNSESLDNDFRYVIMGAKSFVNELFAKSGNNEIFRVGVLGFSNMKQVKKFPITTLNATTRKNLLDFIDNLEMSKGTALYYSIEQALQMLEEDVKNNIAEGEYRESRIYTFTDGLDQASVDDERKLFTPDDYYNHLLPQMKGSKRKQISVTVKGRKQNRDIYSSIITARGGDMTDKQYELFHRRSNESFDTVVRLTNMSELVKTFERMATNLVNSNYVLYCYIPKGVTGRVGWTFDDKAPKAPREKKIWVGLGLEGGMYDRNMFIRRYGYYSSQNYLLGGLDIDITFPLSSWYGLGASFGATIETYDMDFGVHFGLLNKFTFRDKSAILLGAGLKTGDARDAGGYIRLGLKFKSRWYITGTFWSGDSDSQSGIVGGIGYSIFGGK